MLDKLFMHPAIIQSFKINSVCRQGIFILHNFIFIAGKNYNLLIISKTLYVKNISESEKCNQF